MSNNTEKTMRKHDATEYEMSTHQHKKSRTMVVESMLMNAAASCNDVVLNNFSFCLGYCNEQVEFEKKNFHEQAQNAMVDMFNLVDSSRTTHFSDYYDGQNNTSTTIRTTNITTTNAAIEECQSMLFDEESVCSRITNSSAAAADHS